MQINWQCLSFEELTTRQLYAILSARCAVFVVEQHCVYQDIDDIDQVSHHLCAWNQQGQLLAYLRLLPAQIKFPEVSIGRVLSTATGRGLGIGQQLLSYAINSAQNLYPNQAIRISAQHYLEAFYQKFGFVSVSEIYLEDNIPHIEMLKNGTHFKHDSNMS